MARQYHDGTSTNTDEIFVFGSNLQGDHAGGAALFAWRERGATQWVGQGLTERYTPHHHDLLAAYALPTCYKAGAPMTLDEVAAAVVLFKAYARTMAGHVFFVTAVGCGIAGFTDAQIAPLFADAPDNCLLPPLWRVILEPEPIPS